MCGLNNNDTSCMVITRKDHERVQRIRGVIRLEKNKYHFFKCDDSYYKFSCPRKLLNFQINVLSINALNNLYEYVSNSYEISFKFFNNSYT